MEIQEHGSGTGSRVSVKDSIKYFCDMITALGVSGLTPETLRLAKFNKLESPQILLHALHDIVKLSIPERTSASTNPGQKQQLTEAAKPLESVWDYSSDDEVLGFVKFHLALWGYPAHSPFFVLHVDSHGNSRHYLLALGWMISRCHLIDRGLQRRLQPLLASRNAAPLPDDFPVDMAVCSEALEAARHAECAARDYVERMVAATDRVEGVVLQTEMRADQALVLYGQVRACLNAIEALQQSKVKRLHELELAQLAAGVKHPHSPYELHLLQHRKKLDLHCQAIAAAKAMEEETEACRKHEALFWQWMESVAHEELSRSSISAHLDTTGVSEAELAVTIEHLKRRLATCEQENETSLSCKNDHEPRDAKEIAEFFLRPPIFVYKPKERPGNRAVKVTLRNDEENDPHTALFKTKRLMEVEEMVRGILTRAQAENKAVIMEIMKPVMEDESYVVGGL